MSLDRLRRAVFCCFQSAMEVFTQRPLTAVALCRSMREAQRTRHFPLRFSRTVDVVSILLNVPPRHAAKYNLQVKNSPTLLTRNTSDNKRDLRSFH
jgi:hypothetical protein